VHFFIFIAFLCLTCAVDFRKRFLSLLSYKFREFGSVTALSILEAANAGIKDEDGDKIKGTFCHGL
jgi:Possible tRNA binding domain